MDELKKISQEMADLLRQKNTTGFSNQVVTRDGMVVGQSNMPIPVEATSAIAPTTNVPTSGVTNVTDTATSYVVKNIPRTGGHW